MNKQGFTLVEIISVIALLGLVLIITVPAIGKSSENAKKQTLLSKIENIEKAAVLYGQDNRNKINLLADDSTEYPYCKKEDGTLISNCYYYLDDKGTVETLDDTTLITVGLLVDPNGDGNTRDGYINWDDEEKNLILNSTDESKSLNDCVIQIYQKYGKIYAVYDKEYKDETKDSMKCWVD